MGSYRRGRRFRAAQPSGILLVFEGLGYGVRIGRNPRTYRIVRLKEWGRSTYIIGAQGEGKSALLSNLIQSDIAQNDKGIVLLDPHGDLARSVVARCPPDQAHRVTLVSYGGRMSRIMGLNPFEIRSEREFELKVEAIKNVFAHTWYDGTFRNAPTMQNTIETLVRTLLRAYHDYQTSMLHMLLLTRLDPVGDAWRKRLAPYAVDNAALYQNWVEWMDRRRLQEDINSTRQKVKHLTMSDALENILFQPKSADCFQFQDVLSNNGVLLVDLQGLNEESQRLLGSMILTQLLVMAKLREDESDRVPCHLYADEFHLFSPESFVDIINQARKYSLSCTLAHQNLAQLGSAARKAAFNCGNVIAFRVGPEDASAVSKHFMADGQPAPPESVAKLKRFEALVRYVHRRERPQEQISTYPEQGTEDTAVAMMIRARSELYGTPRAEIEAYKNAILKPAYGSGSTKKPVVRRKRTPSDDEPGQDK